METARNRVIEWSYQSDKIYSDPFNQIKVYAMIQKSGRNAMKLPGFFAGNQTWSFRFSSVETGKFTFTTGCSDETNHDLHLRTGEITVHEYEGEHKIYKHGPLKRSQGLKYLIHEDDTPFLWLGDTWWMSLTKRLSLNDFKSLLNDRVKKNYSVAQIVMGLYPDMMPFDERGANERGFPWTEDYQTINHAYFDWADQKIQLMIEEGIMPCLVACWGFFLRYAGVEVIKKHWEYIIARYGAYPVVWCLAGEALMPFYMDYEFHDPVKQEEYMIWAKEKWTEIALHVREYDPYKRVLTVHPTQYGRDMLNDDRLMDMEMLQTGHGGFTSLASTVDMVNKAVSRKPVMPVINSEVCYEGICGTSYCDIQRFLYYSCMLSGTCGFTYGANGIWQVNTEEIPYGPSPHGATWGDTPWNTAAALPGSMQIGLAKKLLEEHEWWNFENHQEWVEEKGHNNIKPYAAGIPKKIRIIFMPFFAGLGWQFTLRNIEPDIMYSAYFFDPVTGEKTVPVIVRPDVNGNWTTGKITKFQDWVIVLSAI
ncbi:MAG: DUF4038 domain-containing protein [Clostridia bacterium]|nr:DUF4038 domain-containing protein [Clostridia bacterium]